MTRTIWGLAVVLLFFSCADESQDPLPDQTAQTDNQDNDSQKDDVNIPDLDPEATLFKYHQYVNESFVFLTTPQGDISAIKPISSGQTVEFMVKELENFKDSFSVHTIDRNDPNFILIRSFENVFSIGSEFPPAHLLFEEETLGYHYFQFNLTDEIDFEHYNYGHSTFSSEKSGSLNIFKGKTEVHGQPSFSYYQHRYKENNSTYYLVASDIALEDTIMVSQDQFKECESSVFVDPSIKGLYLELEGVKDNIDFSVTQGQYDQDFGTIQFPENVFDYYKYAYFFDDPIWSESSLQGATKSVPTFSLPSIDFNISGVVDIKNLKIDNTINGFNGRSYVLKIDEESTLFVGVISNGSRTEVSLLGMEEKLREALDGLVFNLSNADLNWLEIYDIPENEGFETFVNQEIKQPYYIYGRNKFDTNQSSRFLETDEKEKKDSAYEFWRK